MSRRAIGWAVGIVIVAAAVIAFYTLYSKSAAHSSERPPENPKSLSAIAQETQEGTREERAAAVKRVSPQVAATIKDASAPVAERMSALELARDADGPEIVPALKTAAEDEDAIVRAAAVSTLAAKDVDGALPALLKAAKDEDVNVRRATVHALAKQDGKEALAALVQLLGDEDSLVRKVASNALKQKTQQDFGYQYFAFATKREAAVEKWRMWLASHEE